MNPTINAVEQFEGELEQVEINYGKIEEFVERHSDTDFKLPRWDAPVFPVLGEQVTKREAVDFFVVGNALNFCFNDPQTGEKFEVNRDGNVEDGAFGMWACLYHEQFKGELDLLNSEGLKNVTREDFRRVFQPSNNTPMPLIEKRVSFLNDLGRGLESLDGSFADLIPDAENVSLFGKNGFVTNLIESAGEAYVDNRTYDGEVIPFNKRAQLAAMMLHGYFQDTDYFTVQDTTGFAIPADYGVPNTLRSIGILDYSDEISSLIDSQVPIEENSVYEVELRIATVLAGEILLEEFNSTRDSPIGMPELDYFLWSLRRDTEHPEHLTVTTAY